MGVVVPAILPKSKEDLDEKLRALAGLVDEVQIDIVDGRFAAPASWPCVFGTNDVNTLLAQHEFFSQADSFRFEVDLMVEDPEATIGSWLSLGATRLTLHMGSTTNLGKLLATLQKKYGHHKDFAPDLISLGLAVHAKTDLKIVEPHLAFVDYVQFMGIKRIGHQGEPFDPSVLEKIAAFRALHPETPIQVDGGVSLKTAPALLRAGVSRLVVGSDLWRAESLENELRSFAMLAEQYGRYE